MACFGQSAEGVPNVSDAEDGKRLKSVSFVNLTEENICGENGELLECRNRTNNALESYNHRFNDLFPAKPILLTFVQVLQMGSWAQAKSLNEIWSGKRRPNIHQDSMIPKVLGERGKPYLPPPFAA